MIWLQYFTQVNFKIYTLIWFKNKYWLVTFIFFCLCPSYHGIAQEMIHNYLLYINALNVATMSIHLKRKSVFSRCGSLFMFGFSAYTTMVTWFLSRQNVNINKLPHWKVVYFAWRINLFMVIFREYYNINVTD